MTKKDAGFYTQLQAKYESFTKGNEYLTIPEALDVVATRTISLMTTDVKTRKLTGVSRETIE